MKTEFLNLLARTVSEIGAQADVEKLEGVAAYAAERAAHLATIVHEPGFEDAVDAERDAVALKAAQAITEAADGADAAIRARIVGLVHGALSLGARALVLGLPAGADSSDADGSAGDNDGGQTKGG